MKNAELRYFIFSLSQKSKVDDEYDDETDAHTNDVKERFAPHLHRLVLQ